VLHHLRPAADVPVVQLSIDWNVPPAEHLAIGRALAPLRDEGVLVMGSGNVVHNLRHAFAHMDDPVTPRWAEEFDAGVKRAIVERDAESLVEAVESEVGRMSHPTLDHYLPLLYAVGAAEGGDVATFPIEGFALNSLSMRAVTWGIVTDGR
jgi:4,5-DOPA dioxygenase extradiol